MVAFAEVGDLEARWRPLSTEERARAAVLLEDASSMLRVELPEIDARLDADPPTLDAGIPRMIVCKMVQRAMQSGSDGAVTAVQQTAGPFSQSTSYANPQGDLYLTKAERKMLGLGRAVAFSIDTRATGQGRHVPRCSFHFGGECSCGASKYGRPIFEVGE